jgi:predicted dehydrogenase
MDVIKVAIVGCGRIAGLHQMGYRQRDDARIVAVCDVKKGRAAQCAKKWGVEKVYTDYEQLLADPEVQLVELLVPHRLHAEMSIQACQAGKHVSVQKPMAVKPAWR